MKDYSAFKNNNNHTRLKLGILAVFFLILVLGAGALYINVKAKSTFTSFSNEFVFEINRGESVSDVASRLEEEGIVSSEFVFKVYTRLQGQGGNIRAGSFLLDSNMSTSQILTLLSRGRGLSDEARVTLPEGKTVAVFAELLEEAGVLDAQALRNIASDPRQFLEYEFLSDVPQSASLEGYFFPDTYNFGKNSSALAVAEKLLDNLDKKLNMELREEIEKQGKTIFEIITMASIIEGEVGRNKSSLSSQDLEKMEEERRLVAGVFYNRLAVNHPLQSDATLAYATGQKKLQLSFEDTQNQNPYNTYQFRGLPPGPINNPSLDSIIAAIFPAQTDYFYFLSKTDGEAVFGVTLEEHNENKARFLR